MTADYPRFAAQRGRLSWWVRQGSDTAEGRAALSGGEGAAGYWSRLLHTITAYGYGQALAHKVMDGVRWQAEVAGDGTPLTGPADLTAARDSCAAHGKAFIPVVVPRYWAGDAPAPEQQAEQHAAIARHCGVLMIDAEPYPGFVEIEHGRFFPAYWARLRAQTEAFLINQPDPRPWGLAGARVRETRGCYDAICAQHYVGWVAGGVNWVDVAVEAARFRALTAELAVEAYATLYAADRADLAAAFARAIAGEVQGLCGFALGPATAGQLATIGAAARAAVTTLPEPLPLAPPAPSYEQVQLGIIRKVLDGSPQAMRAARDDLAKLVG